MEAEINAIPQQPDKADGTIGKALTVLEIVESFHQPVRFKDILAKSSFPKPSTYRLLQTLVRQSLVNYEPNSNCYLLGSRLIRLAHSAWQSATLAPIAAPWIDDLSKRTGETIHLAQLDNGQVLYVDKRNANRPIPMFSDAGKIAPCYCTGVGKAMLAYLPVNVRDKMLAQQSYYAYTEHSITSAQALEEELQTIIKEGFALDQEEHEHNIVCIAVPILTTNGQLLGGLSITSSTHRTSPHKLKAHKKDLQHYAQQIGKSAATWMLPKIGG